MKKVKIVIDSNVLFSALIKDALTRKLILEYEEEFLFPQYIFEEMQKHKELLLKKSKMSEKEFSQLLNIILRKVIIIPTEHLKAKEKEAKKLAQDIDPDDALFFACALVHNAIIWSDDKALKKQEQINVINTKEIKELFE